MTFTLRLTSNLIPPDTTVIVGACRCGARWEGEAIAHCATCHLTFGSVSGFDDHRDRRGEGRCRTPDELGKRGLSPNEDGHWRRPMTAAAKARVGRSELTTPSPSEAGHE